MTKAEPNFRPALARAKGLGTAHEGVRHWWGQRLSALLLIPLSLWFVMSLGRHLNSDYQTLVVWIAQPWIGTALALLISSLFYHTYLGLVVIVEDYIHSPFGKYFSILFVRTFCLGLFTLSLFFILRIAILGTSL